MKDIFIRIYIAFKIFGTLIHKLYRNEFVVSITLKCKIFMNFCSNKADAGFGNFPQQFYRLRIVKGTVLHEGMVSAVDAVIQKHADGKIVNIVRIVFCQALRRLSLIFSGRRLLRFPEKRILSRAS